MDAASPGPGAVAEEQCPICLDALRRPVVSPCPGRHRFCRACLRGLAKLECPLCRDTSSKVATFFLRRSEPAALERRAEWRALQLRGAAAAGKAHIVRALLRQGCKVDLVDEEHRTPLRLSGEAGKLDVVRLLLRAQASLNKADGRGITPLHAAAEAGHLGVVQQLVEAGAFKNKADREGRTAIFFASEEGHLSVVRFLVEQGTSRAVSTRERITPLHAAAWCPYGTQVVRYLVEDVGMALDVIERNGNTPLHNAAAAGAVESVQFLLSRGLHQLHRRNRRLEVPVHLAAANGHILAVRALCEAQASMTSKDAWGETPLSTACAEGHQEVVRYLIEMRAEVGMEDNGGLTPLHHAAEGGHRAVVLDLLEARARVDKLDFNGATALVQAVHSGRADVAEALLDAGASKAVDPFSATLLQIAASTGIPSLVRMLIDKGVSTNKTNPGVVEYQQRSSALHIAASFNSAGHTEVVELLLEAKAYKNTTNCHGETPLHLSVGINNVASTRALLAARASVNKESELGFTPLICATEQGFAEVVDLLLKARASLNKPNAEGMTPLMVAVQTPRAPPRQGLRPRGRQRRLEVLRALVQTKAALDRGAPRSSDTPLMVAARRGDLAMVKILAEAGASIKARNGRGHTAEHLAMCSGSDTVVKYLRRRADRGGPRTSSERPRLGKRLHSTKGEGASRPGNGRRRRAA